MPGWIRIGLGVLILLLIGSCGGGALRTADRPADPATIDPQMLLAGLPDLSSLADGPVRRISSTEENIAGYPGMLYVSDNVEHVSVPDSAILHSTAGECSWALYHLTPNWYDDVVPYLAPYMVYIHTLNATEFYLAAADYRLGAWRIKSRLYETSPDDLDMQISLGLEFNCANVEGTCWIAIIAFGGAAPQIASLDLSYPDVPAVSGDPVEYWQFIRAEDDTGLATSIYLPYAETDPLIPDPPYPVLLMRTPYDKDAIPSWIAPLLTDGNIVVMYQYFRGRLGDTGSWPDSGGSESMFRDHAGPDHSDAIDTVSWIEGRHWYNGQLIMSGPSALGLCSYQAAAGLGDRLTAMYPQISSADVGQWAVLTNGCYRQSNVEGWISEHSYPDELIDELEANYGNETYWNAVDFDQRASQVTCPGYHETGWWDVNVSATIKTWRELQHSGGPGAIGNQWLVIGPWAHDGPRTRSVGWMNFPDGGDLHDPAVIPAGWDGAQWILNEIGRWPFPFSTPEMHVLAYFIGAYESTTEPHNTWYELNDWPPVPDREDVLYIAGEDSLDVVSPAIESSVSFETDPADPVPTNGGANLPVGGVSAGPSDQTAAMAHDDVLKFRYMDYEGITPVAGELRAVLFVSTTAEDTDIIIKLTHELNDDMNPLIAETGVRLSWYLEQQGLGPVAPGTVYELEVAIGDVAYVLDDIYDIHLVVQGSNYPRFAINPGNGDPFYDGSNGVVQETTIHYGGEYPSRLILPIYDPL